MIIFHLLILTLARVLWIQLMSQELMQFFGLLLVLVVAAVAELCFAFGSGLVDGVAKHQIVGLFLVGKCEIRVVLVKLLTG
jgi:hypothetical protein